MDAIVTNELEALAGKTSGKNVTGLGVDVTGLDCNNRLMPVSRTYPVRYLFQEGRRCYQVDV